MPAEKNARRITDVRTKTRIHEHLSNKNDRISEEDIKNVITSFGEDNLEVKFAPESDPLLQNKNSGGNQEPGIETTWNLIR